MVSSRSSYPSFLSVQESIALQLSWLWQGLYDAFRWTIVISTVWGDAEIRANIYKSLLLNSLSLTFIYAFDLLILPLVTHNQKFLYQILWLLPVIGVSYYLNNTWCSVIAKRTYVLQHGNHGLTSPQPATYTGMLTTIATSAYRVVMVLTSVIVSFALGYIPYIGPVTSFLFMCWIDSYYCFEFVWIARGLSLSRRIRHLEERWAYYLAFGLPSAALCTWGSSLANAVIFALVFPMYIIMAMHARPVPMDPYNPQHSRGDNDDVVRHPSPFIPIRLPIFAPVMWLNDCIITIVSVAGGGRRKSGIGRGRAFSETADSVEDGHEMKFEQPKVSKPIVTSRIRIGRRKLD